MSLRVTLNDEAPVDWDVSIGEKGGLLQSTYWGSLMVALGRGHPIYLQAFDGAKLVASLLAIHLKEKGGRIARRLAMALTLSSGRIEFGDGPLIHDAAKAGKAVAALLDTLIGHAGKNRIRLVRANGLSVANGLAGGADLAAAFAARSFSASRWATFLVDLTPNEETLLMSIDHAARKGVRKAAREGVRTERLTEWEDYREKFLLPYHSWTRPGENVAAFLADAKAIWAHPGHHDHYEHHVAIADDGAVLAVLGMYCFADVATEITSGVSPLAIERKLPAQDLLHWEMFRAARARGCRTFDLAGVSPEPQNGKEENIRRFKKKWGGAYTEFDRFEWRHWSLELMARAGDRFAGAACK